MYGVTLRYSGAFTILCRFCTIFCAKHATWPSSHVRLMIVVLADKVRDIAARIYVGYTGRMSDTRREKPEVKHQELNIEPQKAPAFRPKWWMKLAAVVISPLVCLILIELLLWVVGYGIPRRFFVPWKTGGRTVYLSNKRYCEHFVSKQLSRAPECLMIGPKAGNVVRIFVLGSSAAYGDPEPAYGFCRQLEVLLNEHASGVSFEVVNAAVTAMNSHVAVRIAEDAARLQPDLFIVYMGNNEVVGPYGPTSLPPMLYSSRAFINAAITAKKETLLGQLVKNAGEALRSRGHQQKWQGMEAFLTNHVRRDDPRMESCYSHFAANIRDIVQTANRSGAKTILCTVPTNIESCRPFGSDHAPTLTKDRLAQWQQFFDQGQELAKAGNHEAALAQYEQARAIDGDAANLAFRTAQSLAALGRADEAKQKFIEARERDTLRFRADSRINAVLRAACQTPAAPGVTLLDLEARLAEKSKNHMLGDELLVDHVHLNFKGNCLAAAAALETIAGILPQAKLNVVPRTDEKLVDLCRRRLAYDDAEEYRLALTMHRRKTLSPFADQMDHDAEQQRLAAGIADLRRATKGVETPQAFYLEAIQKMPLDPYLNLRYGEWLSKKGRTAEAMALYEKLLTTWPGDMRVRIAMAQTYIRGGLKDQALVVLTATGSPDHCSRMEALLLLGAYCGSIGATGDAALIYDELIRIAPRNIDGLINRAAAALEAGDTLTMERCLTQALKIDPGSAQAMINMGNCLAKQSKSGEAQKWFERAVQVEPYNYLGRIGLGIQSVLVGQQAKGLEHVATSVALKPDFVEGHQILAALLAQAGKTDEAKQQEALAVLFAP
jgi:tetratricopeptide (TPR) repeat protein